MKIKKQKREKKLRGKKVKETVRMYYDLALEQSKREHKLIQEVKDLRELRVYTERRYNKLKDSHKLLLTSIKRHCEHSSLLPPDTLDMPFIPWNYMKQRHMTYEHLLSTASERELQELTSMNMYLVDVMFRNEEAHCAVHFYVRIWNQSEGDYKHAGLMITKEAFERDHVHVKDFIGKEIHEKLMHHILKGDSDV